MRKAKYRILFVCTGNVCRSPMAEYLLRHRLGGRHDVVVGSAGVFAADGVPASREAVQALDELGIDLTPHRSRMLAPDLVEAATHILVMTERHRQEVVRAYPAAASRVRLATSFGAGRAGGDIADPIGLPLSVYRRVRDELDAAVADLILHLVEKEGLETPALERRTHMKMALGSDHAGFELKEEIKHLLEKRNVEVQDVGCSGKDSTDYPDYAAEVARRVSEGTADQGLLVCATGIGMSIVANKQPRVRAALCLTPHMAKMARAHNNANVLSIGSTVTPHQDIPAILDAWLGASFEAGGRHERRVNKMDACLSGSVEAVSVRDVDPDIYGAIQRETVRQRENIELIASENYVSRAVREAQGSVMTNKYAEGYPGKRWYNGCEFVDEAERLAIERAKQLFGAEHANVQPHSGSGANMAVYFAMLQPGDTILAMSLAHGGHLTHGHKVNFSGRFFNVVPYGVDAKTERINYDEVEALAKQHKPKMICAGASAYSRVLDFPRLRQIADGAGALLMVDMAHIAGLVAAGLHPNPVPYCEFVTTTTHKTLRGPRGGMVLCQAKFAQDIDRQVFPGVQGGPLMHVVAAKAVCFHEALQPSFKDYARQVVKNAQVMSAALEKRGVRIVSGGTDNHLMLVDLTPVNVTGKDAATALDKARITVNKNAIPFDKQSPFVTSGIRVGTPAVTTRGMKEAEMERIAGLITDVLKAPQDEGVIARVREQVVELTSRFPVP